MEGERLENENPYDRYLTDAEKRCILTYERGIMEAKSKEEVCLYQQAIGHVMLRLIERYSVDYYRDSSKAMAKVSKNK